MIAAAGAPRLERDRIILVVGAALAIVAVLPVMLTHGLTRWPWPLALALFNGALVLLFGLARRDRLLLHLWLFGLVFGFGELAVDAYLVDATGTLSYAPYEVGGGRLLWRSPVFMPFAWQVLAIHITCLGDALSRWRPRVGLVLTAIIGGLYIPFGEEMAHRAHLWRYRDVAMVLHVPHYIIAGELLLAVAFTLLLPVLRRERVATSVLAGCAAAGALFVTYAASLWALGRVGPTP